MTKRWRLASRHNLRIGHKHVTVTMVHFISTQFQLHLKVAATMVAYAFARSQYAKIVEKNHIHLVA